MIGNEDNTIKMSKWAKESCEIEDNDSLKVMTDKICDQIIFEAKYIKENTYVTEIEEVDGNDKKYIEYLLQCRQFLCALAEVLGDQYPDDFSKWGEWAGKLKKEWDSVDVKFS